MIQNVQAQPTSDITQLIDPCSTNDWIRLVRRTQLLLFPFYNKMQQFTSDASLIERAKRLWFLSAMPDTIKALTAGKLRELDVRTVDVFASYTE